MIDYKKYLQVKEILENPVIQDKASAICDVFDTKQSIGGFGYVKPMTLSQSFGGSEPVPCTQCIGVSL